MRTLEFWLLYGLSLVFSLAALGCLTLLFCSGQMWLRESQTVEEAAPVTGKFVQARDAKMFVFEEGRDTDPAVVLIHGMGAWGGLWGETADPLAGADFRPITIDLPPFGISQKLYGADNYTVDKQAQRILDVLDNLGVKKAVLVCHSVGCRPTMEAAMLRPGLAQKLVLVDPALGFADDKANPHFEQNHAGGLLRTFFSMKFIRNAALATYGTHPFSVPSIFRSFVYNRAAVNAGRIELMTYPLNINGITNAYGDWMEHLFIAQEAAYTANFANFKVLGMPSLIFWGRQDTLTPLWQGEALQKMLPAATLKVVDNCGHIPYLEQTDGFNALLLKFLQNKPLDGE